MRKGFEVMIELKYIFQIEFYYWFQKQLGLYFYWHIKDGKRIRLTVSIWEYHKMLWYDNGADWYTKWTKHFTIWKRKVVKNGINTMND